MLKKKEEEETNGGYLLSHIGAAFSTYVCLVSSLGRARHIATIGLSLELCMLIMFEIMPV